MFTVRLLVPELLRFTPRPDALDHLVSLLRSLDALPERVEGSHETWRVLQARDRDALDALKASLRAVETGTHATAEDHFSTTASSVTVRPDRGGYLLERRRDPVRLLHFFLGRAQLPFQTEGRDTLVACPPMPPGT